MYLSIFLFIFLSIYLSIYLSTDTEDPELLKNLDFVSPKAGVYRPVNPGKSKF